MQQPAGNAAENKFDSVSGYDLRGIDREPQTPEKTGALMIQDMCEKRSKGKEKLVILVRMDDGDSFSIEFFGHCEKYLFRSG